MGAAIKAPFDCTATPTPARSVWLSVAKTSLGRAHATPPSAKMARSRQLNFSLIEHDKYPQLKFLIMEQPTPASTPEVLQELTRNNVFHVVRVAEENEYDYRADFQENNFECFVRTPARLCCVHTAATSTAVSPPASCCCSCCLITLVNA